MGDRLVNIGLLPEDCNFSVVWNLGQLSLESLWFVFIIIIIIILPHLLLLALLTSSTSRVQQQPQESVQRVIQFSTITLINYSIT